MINCNQCGEHFTATNKRGPRPRFCSAKCKQKHYRSSKHVTPPSRPQPKLVTKLVTPELKSELKPISLAFIRERKVQAIERGDGIVVSFYAMLEKEYDKNLRTLWYVDS